MATQSPTSVRHPEIRTAEQVTELKHQWSAYQRRHSLKTTAQRELIVDVFLTSNSTDSHVSIDELLTSVRRRNPRVGYATVYRQFGDGQTRYEVAGSESRHHDHLICQKCRLILEFEEPEIERLQDTVASRLGGFKVIQHKLELYGLCPKEQGVVGGLCPGDTVRQEEAGEP